MNLPPIPAWVLWACAVFVPLLVLLAAKLYRESRGSEDGTDRV